MWSSRPMALHSCRMKRLRTTAFIDERHSFENRLSVRSIMRQPLWNAKERPVCMCSKGRFSSYTTFSAAASSERAPSETGLPSKLLRHKHAGPVTNDPSHKPTVETFQPHDPVERLSRTGMAVFIVVTS